MVLLKSTGAWGVKAVIFLDQWSLQKLVSAFAVPLHCLFYHKKTNKSIYTNLYIQSKFYMYNLMRMDLYIQIQTYKIV